MTWHVEMQMNNWFITDRLSRIFYILFQELEYENHIAATLF